MCLLGWGGDKEQRPKVGRAGAGETAPVRLRELVAAASVRGGSWEPRAGRPVKSRQGKLERFSFGQVWRDL